MQAYKRSQKHDDPTADRLIHLDDLKVEAHRAHHEAEGLYHQVGATVRDRNDGRATQDAVDRAYEAQWEANQRADEAWDEYQAFAESLGLKPIKP